MSNTYLHIFSKLLQKHFLVLLINVYLLPIIDEVIVLIGGQLLGLSSVLEISDQVKQSKKAR